ncbi:MAG: aminopeptidase P family protein [Anaerorhabdus sp.]
MLVKDKIEFIQKLIKEKNIDAYYVPTSDPHQSEYLAEHFKVRQFLSGFSGSRADLVITKDNSFIWVDGRYFTQADKELKDSGIEIFKMGEPGVLKLHEHLAKILPDNGVLAFDMGVCGVQTKNIFVESLVKLKNIELKDISLIDELWTDRPSLKSSPYFMLDEKFTGESVKNKLTRVRSYLNGTNNGIFVSALEDVAWVFNLRGKEIKNTPVFFSYAYISNDEAIIFLNEDSCNEDILSMLNEANVRIQPYNSVNDFLSKLRSDIIYLDRRTLNSRIEITLLENKGCKYLKFWDSPILLMRSLKNECEIENFKKAHIKDGLALCKFIYWLKSNISNQEISEFSAKVKLDELRSENDLFIEPSFDSITAYASNAAMMHYSAKEEGSSILKDEGLFLVDSGGQYYEGTTDVTRTIVLGKISDRQKECYTAVLKGMISLSKSKFLSGCSGADLDVLARAPIWDLELDYKCGTGHGVGFCLGVHEGPQGFRYGVYKEVLRSGMILTNEPGVYITDEFGIRIENQLVVRNDINNDSGQFMRFDYMTIAPIDLAAVNVEDLTKSEKDYLNSYHKNVYDTLSVFLNDDEKRWLKQETRSI